MTKTYTLLLTLVGLALLTPPSFAAFPFGGSPALNPTPVTKKQPARQNTRGRVPSVGSTSLLAKDTTAAPFTADVYAKLVQRTRPEDNLLFSPISISTVLSLAASGAKGETQSEMLKVLHSTQADLPAITQRIATQMENWNRPSRYHQLALANGLFLQKNYPIEGVFGSLAKQKYKAVVANLDFARAAETSRARINAWVSKKTMGRIKGLLPQGSITRDTRVVLANALYFRSDWLHPFEKQRTRLQNFTLPNGRTKMVQMMFQEGGFNYYQDDDIQMVFLPYRNKALQMCVILPRKRNALPALEKNLTGEKLATWLSKGQQQGASPLKIYLPKFKFEKSISLAKVLHELGMKKAFAFQEADFTGISKQTPKLVLSSVLHRAVIDLDEKGTTAAAATAMTLALGGGGPPIEPEKIIFRADHPFLIAIVDTTADVPLFFGRVATP